MEEDWLIFLDDSHKFPCLSNGHAILSLRAKDLQPVVSGLPGYFLAVLAIRICFSLEGAEYISTGCSPVLNEQTIIPALKGRHKSSGEIFRPSRAIKMRFVFCRWASPLLVHTPLSGQGKSWFTIQGKCK